jgi:beta-lactamase superfamily II metal-dependent hydrolase
MHKTFRIHVLPAQRGDCLWIEYGQDDAPRHILIDGGITSTGRDHLRKRIEEMAKPLHFELLLISHVDLDHIQGILHLLENPPADVTFGDIWFNGLDQMKQIGLETMGIKEGIRLSEILTERYKDVWNKAANGKAIALDRNDDVASYQLADGMAVTVLAPTHKHLAILCDRWEDVLKELHEAQGEAGGSESNAPPDVQIPGLEPMGADDDVDVEALALRRFDEDNTVPNGSSIALALQFNDKTALLLADAYPSVIVESLRRLSPNKPYAANIVKLAHHGSRANTDSTLVAWLNAPIWIFSSNGAGNTKHPHQEAVARVVQKKDENKTLAFNYRTRFNEMWDDTSLMHDYNYRVIYGDGTTPMTIYVS